MRQLVLTPRFKRAYRKFVTRDAKLQKRVETTLQQREDYVFASALATHSLKGELLGLKACSCGYDCRLVFSIEIDPNTQDEVILLLDVGTHDEVY
jgi:mRNA-degrading endonuclease YafQ of YafQ-DinJ toxin-antitoxin module